MCRQLILEFQSTWKKIDNCKVNEAHFILEDPNIPLLLTNSINRHNISKVIEDQDNTCNQFDTMAYIEDSKQQKRYTFSFLVCMK